MHNGLVCNCNRPLFEFMPRGVRVRTTIKALKYFRVCDSDGSGEIDLEEFKVALFAVDPDSGNTVGFAPNAFLTPLDAFEVG